ncbi:LIM domain transcription factor LMO4.2 [Camponotus floridanus]|uniref:LIM domain transcription factor LMO4.2 n=1 Tax=Camponotus floridanus TaxID=104421 RepID=E2A0B0_CAMFO|nr:LIM domain transcription factor LMO4.2 [Camponotus floridanus]
MFGSGGVCASCGNAIPANELVMRAGESVFHLKCFNCNKCGGQLVSGDRYYLLSGSPVCESDWHKIVKSGVTAAAAAAAGNSGAPVRKVWRPSNRTCRRPAIRIGRPGPRIPAIKAAASQQNRIPKDIAMKKKPTLCVASPGFPGESQE